MKTPLQTNGLKRLLTILLLAFAMAISLLPQPAKARPRIEQMQREVQARFNYLTGGNYTLWPPCRTGIAAPLYPPDGFYGDLEHDPYFAAYLLQDLCLQFYYDRYPLYYIPGDWHFNYYDGVPLYHGGWLKTDGNMEGQPDSPPLYDDSDFPTSDASFDLFQVTPSNYAACAAVIGRYIGCLNFVVLSEGLISVDPNGLDGAATGSTNANTCADAKADATGKWGFDYDPYIDLTNWLFVGVQTYSCSYSNAGKLEYSVTMSAVRRRAFCPATGYPGTVWLYLNAITNYGCDTTGGTDTCPPVPPDGLYHRFWSASVDGVHTCYGAHIADCTPTVPSGCPYLENNPLQQGWRLAAPGMFSIFAPAFNTDPDNAVLCNDYPPPPPPWPPGDCNGSCGPCTVPGMVFATTGSLDLRISLGPSSYGRSAGYLLLQADTPSPLLSSPVSLVPVIGSGVSIQRNAAFVITQINTTNLQAFLQTNVNGYSLSFSNRATPAQFLSSVTITNAGDTNQLFVSEVIGAGGTPRIIEYSYSAGSGSWTMKQGNGLRIESRVTVWTTPTNRTDTIIVSNNAGAVALRSIESYREFPWGSTRVQETLGTSSNAKTTTRTYGDDRADAGSYGQLKQVVFSTGRWERYQYDPAGRLTNKVAQFGDNAINTSDSANRVTQVSYDDVNGIITTIEKLLNTEISRSYQIDSPPQSGIQQIQTIRCAVTGASISNPANLTNIVWRTSDTSTTGTQWQTIQELLPDGTMTMYANTVDPYTGQCTFITKVGVPNSTRDDIVDGTITTVIVGLWGQPLLRQVQDIASGGLVIDQNTYAYTDSLNRSHSVTGLDNRTETQVYSCCGLDSETDRDGVTTQYSYDAAKRRVATTRLGIIVTNVLDAAGHSLNSLRIGSDASQIVLARSSYGDDGSLSFQTNALNGVTAYAQGTNALGQTIITNTYPDGGTRIETYHQDGSLLSVGGTAAHPVQYLYGLDGGGLYTTEIKIALNGGTNEWVKSSSDMLGRSYKTTFAAASSPYPTTVSTYNKIGQLTNQIDPDGLVTLYAYNPKGEQVYSVLDSNRNCLIDVSGFDQITLTTNDVTTDHGTTVRRSRTYVWDTFGSASATLVSTAESSVDGLQSWQTQYPSLGVAVTSRSQTSYGANGTRTVINTAPDSSYIVNTYSNGRPVSVTRYDASSSQVSKLMYGFDAQGRQWTVTDARNGTTYQAYNSADLISSVTTPNPGTPGGMPQTTYTSYNGMLQATNVILPDGSSVTSEFYPTGELKRNYGSRTYPVSYSYDYAGRMQTMTNWSNFAGGAGARVTTWIYDPYRGWLTGKSYDGGVAGPSYGYTKAGRLQSRAWARGVTTSYGYNWAGMLASVSYSDSTPAVSNAYDRLGRLLSAACNGTTGSFGYNEMNSVLSLSFSGGSLGGLSVTNGFDQFLRRTNIAALATGSPLLKQSFGYDNASRLQTVTDNTTGTAYAATYSYLANSPLVNQITFKQGQTVRMTTTKQFDYLNRLLSASSAPSAGSSLTFNYTCNDANQRVRSALADGGYWLYDYDSLGQVRAGRKYWADGTPVAGQQFEYAFDDIGNRTSTKAGGNQNGAGLRLANYSANTLNQYTSRDIPGAIDIMGLGFATNAVTVNSQAAYRKGEYFRAEVPISNNATSVWQSVAVAATNQSSSSGNVYVPKNPELFYYDADGNLTNDGRWTYTWDAENRLVKLAPNTSVGPRSSLKFEYDWQGRRIHKQVWANTTWNGTPANDVKFLYDGWNLVAELNATNNAVIRSFMWGLDLSGSIQGAGGVGGMLEVTYTGALTTNCFVAFDGNGNVAGLVNAGDGTLLAQYEYGPFGEVIRATGPMAKANPFRFSTKYQDDETDLLYYGYRYYSASTGRWLSRDPIGERGGSNLYRFNVGNPISHIDKLGLLTETEACCVCFIAHQLKTEHDDVVLDYLLKNLAIKKAGHYTITPLLRDFVLLGKRGGRLGFAFLARTACGPKLTINTINDPNNKTFHADWDPKLMQLDLNMSYREGGEYHYEYLPWELHEFLGDFPESGAITLAHELGHAYLSLLDPFNVYVVENPIRRAFGVSRRDRYLPSHEDNPDRRGDGQGLVWRGENAFDFPDTRPATQWWNMYHNATASKVTFMKEWGGTHCEGNQGLGDKTASIWQE
jgi:RHS repeat-associated protein